MIIDHIGMAVSDYERSKAFLCVITVAASSPAASGDWL